MSKYKNAFYTAEYQGFAEELKDVSSLKAYADTLSSSVNDAINLSQRLIGDLGQMTGMSIDELKQSNTGGLIESLNNTGDIISGSLIPTIAACESLADGLKAIETSEDDLCTADDEKISLESNPVDIGEYDIKKNTFSNIEEYREWNSQLVNLTVRITFLLSACNNLKSQNDKNIDTIKQFNQALEDFSSSLFAFSVSLGNTDFKDFASLSTKEKEKVLGDMLKELKNKYRELKRNLESSKREVFLSIFCAIQGEGNNLLNIDPYKPISFESFQILYDFLYEMYDGKYTYEIINNYFNGETWEESGMEYLCRQFDGFAIGLNNEGVSRGTVGEEKFIYLLMYYLAGENIKNPSEILSLSNFNLSGLNTTNGITISDLYDLLYDSDEDTRKALIKSLKETFVSEGNLDFFNGYIEDMNNIMDENGNALSLLHALDGRSDWLDNNSVIPVDVIDAYFSGKSWEESGLAKYCGGKTEAEFLADFIDVYDSDYKFPTYTWDGKAHSFIPEKDTFGHTICSIDRDTLIEMINNGEDVSQYINEMKSNVVNSGILGEVDSYYERLNNRNNIIAAQTDELNATGETIAGLEKVYHEIPYLELKATDDYKYYSSERLTKGWLSTEDGRRLDSGITDGYNYDYLFENMDDEESKMFTYLYKTEGLFAAREYLKTEAATINRRIGFERAEKFASSVRGNNMVTQEEYITRYMNSHHCSEAEARKQMEITLKDNMTRSLIDSYGYNPERARELAEQCDYTSMKIFEGDFLDSLTDFGRTAFSGGTMGVQDLGTNIVHNIVPDAVKTPNNYEAEHIVELFSDPNSEYYCPGLGFTYSASQTIGHKGPAIVLKSFKATKAIGEVVDTLDTTGESMNKAFQKTGDYWGSRVYGISNAGLNYLSRKVTNQVKLACANTGVDSKLAQSFLSNFAGNEVKVVGQSVNNFAFIDGDLSKLKDNVTTGTIGAAIDAIPLTADRIDVGNKFVNDSLTGALKDQVGAFKGTMKEIAGDSVTGHLKDADQYMKSFLGRESSLFDPTKQASKLTLKYMGDGAKALDDNFTRNHNIYEMGIANPTGNTGESAFYDLCRVGRIKEAGPGFAYKDVDGKYYYLGDDMKESMDELDKYISGKI